MPLFLTQATPAARIGRSVDVLAQNLHVFDECACHLPQLLTHLPFPPLSQSVGHHTGRVRISLQNRAPPPCKGAQHPLRAAVTEWPLEVQHSAVLAGFLCCFACSGRRMTVDEICIRPPPPPQRDRAPLHRRQRWWFTVCASVCVCVPPGPCHVWRGAASDREGDSICILSFELAALFAWAAFASVGEVSAVGSVTRPSPGRPAHSSTQLPRCLFGYGLLCVCVSPLFFTLVCLWRAPPSLLLLCGPAFQRLRWLLSRRSVTLLVTTTYFLFTCGHSISF